ncbi:hypothetical protein [Rhodopirellula halodulae]|nr:hypothetical protein [Rhodopirellula sp. JC740]
MRGSSPDRDGGLAAWMSGCHEIRFPADTGGNKVLSLDRSAV